MFDQVLIEFDRNYSESEFTGRIIYFCRIKRVKYFFQNHAGIFVHVARQNEKESQ